MIKDSGNRKEFETGAVRDIHDGKGRCDLLPLGIVGEILGDGFILHVESFKRTGELKYLQYAFSTIIKVLNITRINALIEVSFHFEEGAKKYGEYNWQKGIPLNSYVDSMIRHYLKHLDGWTDERHDRAVIWNLLCAIWTCENKPELNCYLKKDVE